MTDFSRRSFLAALGMTGACLAFKRVEGIIQVPKDLAIYDGEITAQWIAAEGVRQLASFLPYEQFKHSEVFTANGGMLTSWPENARQFGIEIFDALAEEKHMPLAYFSERYIKPAMYQMAVDIRAHKPKTCLALKLPPRLATQSAARAMNQEHGFDLRFVRVFDVGGIDRPSKYINRFDILTA